MCGCQVVVCVIGAFAWLVPVISWTSSFWGIDSFGINDSLPRISRVKPGSLADLAGLMADDQVTSVSEYQEFHSLLGRIRTGESLSLKVFCTGRGD